MKHWSCLQILGNIAFMDALDNDISDAAETRGRMQIREKWGDSVGLGGATGFLAIPEVLIRGQAQLKLSSTEMMVLINVLLHWWYADRKPFPGNEKIAKRMGVTTRTVQRAFESLSEKGLVQREIKTFHNNERDAFHVRRELDLSGLVSRLEYIAQALREYGPVKAQANRQMEPETIGPEEWFKAV